MSAVDTFNKAQRAVPPWSLYIVGVIPAVWLVWLALTGGLSVEPIKELEHRLGELALQMVIAGLAITPLRWYLGVNLIRFRRALGLVTYFYIVLHLLVWLFLDVQILGEIWADILKRPYITVGMLGFVLMTPLAMTSNNWSVRRMGPNWRKLHKLVYGAAILGGVHYMMLAKGFQIEPLVYLSIIALLLILRVLPRKAAQAPVARRA